MKREATRLDLSYYHRGGDEPLSGATIPAHFRTVARRFSGREAVVSRHQNRRLTFGELQRDIDRLARGLIGLGFQKGERIGIWATDNIEWLTLQMATAAIGAVLVNINPAYRPRELIYALQKSELQGLFVMPHFRRSDYVGMLAEAIPALTREPAGETLDDPNFPLLRKVVVFDPADPIRTERPHPGFLTWQDVLAAAETVSDRMLAEIEAGLDRDDPINIQYTSGTTGFPKAVVLTHHNILNNALATARTMNFTEHDRLCVPVPFYHCFGMVLSNLLCLAVGATLVIPAEHFDALATLQAVTEEKCTALHGVPTMFIAELEHAEFKHFDLSTLRTGIMAGAPCPEALMKRVIEDMHCPEILIGYGETEASPLTHLTLPDDGMAERTQTVGRNLPHQEVKVIDIATGRTQPVGQPGEVCFRGYHVMRGYYGDEAATKKTVDEAGWLHSGDIGVMDKRGYLRITGRLKEMIVRAGEKIFPAEIEAWLFTHPKIAEVAVFGVPDAFYGEEVAAWIRLHHGMSMDADEVRAYARDGLAHFKLPKVIRFMDCFPEDCVTVTGKLQKFRMSEREQQAQQEAGKTA